jgi:enoyl-CoA hydratase/carnithine racemase
MAVSWKDLNRWSELYLERMEDAGVARVVLNRPDKRNAQTGTLVQAFFEALEIIRADLELKVVITKGAGTSFSAGLDLDYLNFLDHEPLRDFDRPAITTKLVEALIDFPRITIAQVHGYCLGGSMGLMNVHDLAIAADDAQIGMPEIPRGSFGEIATSTLFHAQIPLKKAALIALTARNISGADADRLGLVSLSVPAPLQHHKIAVQMGRDLPLKEAIRLDQLVGERQFTVMKKALHFEMTHVPYKGVPPAMADIMACNVDVGFGAYNSAFPLIKSDKLSALAVSTETRLPETPDVPTLRESGLQNLEQVESSFSLLTPARTPRYIIELLHREVVELMNTDAMKKDLRSRGMTLITNKRPEEFAAWIAEYLKRYEVIVSDAKVVAQ